ncbi:Uncharacterised protein [Bordetella pertussis]|nr:Uncharacterised protein [Bordetella pertussis]
MPSTAVQRSPMAMMRRSTASDCGPRLTRSPANQKRLSVSPAISGCASNSASGAQQPCTSPMVQILPFMQELFSKASGVA